MSDSQPILISDGPTDPEYEEENFSDEGIEEGILCFYEEEEEESSTRSKLRKVLQIMDKLKELLIEILDEI